MTNIPSTADDEAFSINCPIVARLQKCLLGLGGNWTLGHSSPNGLEDKEHATLYRSDWQWENEAMKKILLVSLRQSYWGLLPCHCSQISSHSVSTFAKRLGALASPGFENQSTSFAY